MFGTAAGREVFGTAAGRVSVWHRCRTGSVSGTAAGRGVFGTAAGWGVFGTAAGRRGSSEAPGQGVFGTRRRPVDCLEPPQASGWLKHELGQQHREGLAKHVTEPTGRVGQA